MSLTQTLRPVWDDQNHMLPEWLTVAQSAILVGAVVNEDGHPYSVEAVRKMIYRGGRLRCYVSPYGRIIHKDDLVEMLRRDYPEQAHEAGLFEEVS